MQATGCCLCQARVSSLPWPFSGASDQSCIQTNVTRASWATQPPSQIACRDQASVRLSQPSYSTRVGALGPLSSSNSPGKRGWVSLDAPTQYRPPRLPIPGVDNTDYLLEGQKKEIISEEEEADRRFETLQQIRTSHLLWHQRALAMREFQRDGKLAPADASELALELGLDFSVMMVGAAVYDSLVTGGASAESLQAYDNPATAAILQELRILTAGQRKVAAEYLVTKGTQDVPAARELAKAIKDHERRPEGRDGFTTAPGDALALMFMRQASEAKDPERRAGLLKQAASVAESETALSRVQQLAD